MLRLALQTGADVVPIYCFGNSQTFRLVKGSKKLQPLARYSGSRAGHLGALMSTRQAEEPHCRSKKCLKAPLEKSPLIRMPSLSGSCEAGMSRRCVFEAWTPIDTAEAATLAGPVCR